MTTTTTAPVVDSMTADKVLRWDHKDGSVRYALPGATSWTYVLEEAGLFTAVDYAGWVVNWHTRGDGAVTCLPFDEEKKRLEAVPA